MNPAFYEPQRRSQGARLGNRMRGRPVSRILSGPPPDGQGTLGDHSSGPAVAGGLVLPTRPAWGRSGPGALARPAEVLFGIAPGGACRAVPVAGAAVGSYPTVSPSPARRRADCSLWRFPSALAARALPGTVAPWSPDFPRARRPAAARPSAQISGTRGPRPRQCPARGWVPHRSGPRGAGGRAASSARSAASAGPAAPGRNRMRKAARRAAAGAGAV